MKTALILLLACLTAQAQFEYQDGGIVRGPRGQKKIALEFSADEFTEGGTAVLDQLAARHVHASFFLTGRCLRHPKNHPLIQRMVDEGNYLGSHSDTHPLLCPWSGPKTNLVSREFFQDEMNQSLAALERFGVKRADAPYFIPPYEWYNKKVVDWSREIGLRLINFTPGTRATADYTENDARNFVSSVKILTSIKDREKKDGLNGYLLLLHLGAGPRRTDKMFDHLGELLDYLQGRGYQLVRVDELLR